MTIAKLARSPGTLFASVEALGVPVQIIGDGNGSTTALSAIRSAWGDCLADRDYPRQRCRVRVPDDATHDAARVLSDLSTQVTLAALDALRGTRLLLHAAGVAAELSSCGGVRARHRVGHSLRWILDRTLGTRTPSTPFPTPSPSPNSHCMILKNQLIRPGWRGVWRFVMKEVHLCLGV